MQILDLFIQSGLLALQAVGGVMATLPALQEMQLMSAEQLAQLVAIGQASPGPNMLLIPLVGWHVAGIPGALVAALGFCLPSAVLVLWMYKRWSAFKQSAWKTALQGVLGAIGAGAVLLSTLSFIQITGFSVTSMVLIIAVAVLMLKTRIPPVVLIMAGATIGMLGIPI